ncbi:hypothetical protein [Halalkalibacter hemicellulosilyticus]|uniref:Uncharacterized protein n=1 Tax=Halalkalibacter hemicellulosilyticusJCM 9152 TaxID=1236971 RepID=W4QLB3_9BACI|nr:hypothetical protein [Halalkalibacter hemicellulosilyticus]GAE32408.1 hypothetical protein JCM9152_3942 [Halalkalibacter hemicellulosilyticusJCM 9152]
MNKVSLFFILVISLIVTGCSNNEPTQLSYEEIEGMPLDEQINSIIENTELIEDKYELIIDGSSVAIVYPAEYISDDRLALDDSKESFPNLAMTLVEHLKVLEMDELVITSYEPSTELTKVSALFLKESIEEIDFEEWEEEKSKFPQRFYRYSDAFLIRGNVWDKLDDETQEKIGRQSKSYDSQFWDYYGSYIE